MVGHVDLLIDAGLVREVADGDLVRFEATGAEGEVAIPPAAERRIRRRRDAGYDPAVSAVAPTIKAPRRRPRRAPANRVGRARSGC